MAAPSISTPSWTTPSATLLTVTLLMGRSGRGSRSLSIGATDAQWLRGDSDSPVTDSANHHHMDSAEVLPLPERMLFTINIRTSGNATASSVDAELSDCKTSKSEDEWPAGDQKFSPVDVIDVEPGQTLAAAFQNATGVDISNLTCVMMVSSVEGKEVLEAISSPQDGIFIYVSTPPVPQPPNPDPPEESSPDSGGSSNRDWTWKVLLPALIIVGEVGVFILYWFRWRPRRVIEAAPAHANTGTEVGIELNAVSGNRNVRDEDLNDNGSNPALTTEARRSSTDIGERP